MYLAFSALFTSRCSSMLLSSVHVEGQTTLVPFPSWKGYFRTAVKRGEHAVASFFYPFVCTRKPSYCVL